jgi:hydrogenase nickel incorporation protein HypA/HybF
MHELSIALSIIDVAAEAAQREPGRVVAVRLRLGPLSGVVRDALESAYELAREGTPLADSRLIVEETSIIVHCPTCAAERAVASIQEMRCSVCGTPAPNVVAGRELDIVALEMES